VQVGGGLVGALIVASVGVVADLEPPQVRLGGPLLDCGQDPLVLQLLEALVAADGGEVVVADEVAPVDAAGGGVEPAVVPAKVMAAFVLRGVLAGVAAGAGVAVYGVEPDGSGAHEAGQVRDAVRNGLVEQCSRRSDGDDRGVVVGERAGGFGELVPQCDRHVEAAAVLAVVAFAVEWGQGDRQFAEFPALEATQRAEPSCVVEDGDGVSLFRRGDGQAEFGAVGDFLGEVVDQLVVELCGDRCDEGVVDVGEPVEQARVSSMRSR
jgi:hypothetical protein